MWNRPSPFERRFTMKRALRWMFLSAGLLLFTTPLVAQGTGTISGRVVDSVTAQPVPGVRVNAVGAGSFVLTDREGRYTLAGVSAGTATVRAQRIGFAAQTRQVAVTDGGSVPVGFELIPAGPTLPGAVVTGDGWMHLTI